MTRIIFTITILIQSLIACSQNYQCVLPNIKQYFTNDNYYLRGIRIDSIKTVGTDTYLYPFRSFRGSKYSLLDTNGGSWIGKSISIKNNGSTYIYNYWNDTVKIETQASLHNTWVLYNDTTPNYYTAEVTSIDTMTILGNLDTIKTITLNCKNSSGIVTTDSLNNIQIIISKNHGFVQALDFGIFPKCVSNIDYLVEIYSNNVPTKKNILFRICNFENADMLEFHTYNPGDKFQYQYYYDNPMYPNLKSREILSKEIISGTEIKYISKRWISVNNPWVSYTSAGIDTVTYYSGDMFMDTLHMPEEWGIRDFYYYNPDDTSFCTNGLYSKYSNHIEYSQPWVNTFEPRGADYKYKKGLGNIYDYRYDGSGPTTSKEYLTRVYKGFPCGPMPYISVEKLPATININIYPNPANETIFIDLKDRAPHTITLVDVMGKLLKDVHTNESKIQISVAEIPQGIYYLHIRTDTGENSTQKITITH